MAALPTKDDLKKLSLRAIVVYVARCARRVQPLVFSDEKVAKCASAIEEVITLVRTFASKTCWTTACALLLFFMTSCDSGAPPQPRVPNHKLNRIVKSAEVLDADEVKIVADPSFVLFFGEGDGSYGYDVLRIASDGACQYTFRNSDSRVLMWHQATFTLSPNEMKALVSKLNQIRFVELHDQYHASVVDGTQVWFKVKCNGVRKSVYCNNHFPDTIVNLKSFMRRNIIDQHRVEISRAKTVSDRDHESPSFEKRRKKDQK